MGKLARTLFGSVSVKDTTINARGDNSTDDSAAFQAAIDLAAVNGGEVIVPPGHYRIRKKLNGKEKVGIRGVNQGGDETGDAEPGANSTIRWDPSGSDTTLFDCTAAAAEGTYANWGNVTGIKVVGTGDSSSDYAFDWLAAGGLRVRDVRVEGFKHAFRLRDQIFCRFNDCFVNSASITGASAFLFDTKSTENGTTTNIEGCYLRLGDYAAIIKADSHSRIRFLNGCLFESTQEGILDVEEGTSSGTYILVDGCESENVCDTATADQALFKFGVNGTGSGPVNATVCNFRYSADSNAEEDSRVLFHVDRGSLNAYSGQVNRCGAGLIKTDSQHVHTSLRDISIDNDDHHLYPVTGIDDIQDIKFDNVGWGGFRLQPDAGQGVVCQHVTLSGSSTETTFDIPNRGIMTAILFRNATAISGVTQADFTGGNSLRAKTGFNTSAGSMHSHVLLGRAADNPSLGSDDPLAYLLGTTSATTEVDFTGTSMSGTIIVAVFYRRNISPSIPL